MSASLSQIRIVLVETSHPGNIGSAARAMKTMGINSLYLVSPLIPPNDHTRALASGAADLIAQAVMVDRLEDAIADCSLVVGCSARSRSISWPTYSPRVLAEKVRVLPGTEQVAVVFGQERSGLTNEQLDLCQYLVNIPANPEYSSLNLAAAVQLICYEFRQTLLAEGQDDIEDLNEPLATQDDMARFYQHLWSALIELGFLKPENPRQLKRRLTRLFNRFQLTKSETNLLRGMLSGVEKQADDRRNSDSV